MKAREVPTSPKLRIEKDQHQSHRRNGWFWVTLVSMIFGLFSGAAITIILDSTNFHPTIPSDKIVETTRTFFTPEGNDRESMIQQSIASLETSIGSIVLKKTPMHSKFKSGPYLEKDVLGVGIILTNDGWIGSTNLTITNLAEKYLFLLADGTSYSVSNWIADPMTPMVFGKIDAENLTSVPFISDELVRTGMEALIFQHPFLGESQVRLSTVKDKHYHPEHGIEDIVYSTEMIQEFYLLDGSGISISDRGVATSLSGEVIGLTVGAEKNGLNILPMSAVLPTLKSLFKDSKIARPDFGIRWISDQRADGLFSQKSRSLDHGALVFSFSSDGGVRKGSPADKAGILPNDWIISINGERVGADRTISRLVQQFAPGDQIEVEVIRGEEPLTISVVLGEY